PAGGRRPVPEAARHAPARGVRSPSAAAGRIGPAARRPPPATATAARRPGPRAGSWGRPSRPARPPPGGRRRPGRPGPPRGAPLHRPATRTAPSGYPTSGPGPGARPARPGRARPPRSASGRRPRADRGESPPDPNREILRSRAPRRMTYDVRMLHRVAVGQPRFNLPGLVSDARGAAMGRQLVARFGAVDRLVSFLRVLSADESLDDLQPGFRIVYARSGAGTREAVVMMPATASELGEAAARAARLARGQLFTGAGKHFVQFRDAQAPLGYDVDGLEQTVPYRIESELALQKLLLRLSLVRLHGPAATLPEGPVYVTARRGLGPVLAEYLHRLGHRGEGARELDGAAPASPAGGALGGRGGGGGLSAEPGAAPEPLRASAALCETVGASAFSPGTTFWLFRIERLPPRLHGLLRRTPGIDVYAPVTNHVAVAAGYRHPIHLESSRASFPSDRLHLFSPRGVVEVAPLPALAAVEDLVRILPPASERAEPRAAAPGGRADLAVALRLEPGGG